MNLKNKDVIAITLDDLKGIINRFKEKDDLIEERTLYGNDTVLKVMRD